MSKTLIIAVLPGDGIGEEVMAAALRVLNAAGESGGYRLECRRALVGGAAYEKFQNHFPEETIRICRESEAILFGSVGGPLSESHLPKWKDCERNSILSLRKEFGFFANLRLLRTFPTIAELSPLKSRLVSKGLDIVVVRELLGDIYFGEHRTTTGVNGREAHDAARYDETEIKRIAHVAFATARKRKKKVVSVDKANVLDTSRLWRAVVAEVAKEYPEVELENILVDNCAMQLVREPAYFDVLLTPNLFGDILSDLISVFGGSLGLMPSASLNSEGFGLYEPAGGSAPDLAGKGIANPIAQILSGALMLRHSFALYDPAERIERAVERAVSGGIKTRDLCLPGEVPATTEEFTNAVLKGL
jgi:3-isopropylmalate dehydrogenase